MSETNQCSEAVHTHTPGPWRQHAPVIDGQVEQDYRTIRGGDGLRGTGFELTGFIAEADARLIAAAPELLDACKLVELWMLGGQPRPYSDSLVLERVRDAIHKAESIT